MSNVQDSLPLVLTVLSGLIWAVRQEGRLNNTIEANKRTQDDVDDLRRRTEHLNSNLAEKLSELQAALARIEGKLDITTHKEN